MKTHILIAAMLAACLTTGCEATPAPPPTLPASAYAPLPKNCKAIVSAWVKAQLKDPYSAHIEFIGSPERSVYKDPSGQWKPYYKLTLLVNGKNSFGGYAGNKLIVVGYDGHEIVFPYGMNPMALAI